MQDILVTGGAGFIGSHICVRLIKTNRKVIIVDNFINSEYDTINNIKKVLSDNDDYLNNIVLYNTDLGDNLDFIFIKHNIYAVIHLAGVKLVSESIKNPIEYYNKNLSITLNLLSSMKKYKCNKLIFSSSATVYGNCISPINETCDIGKGISNPYGKSKYIIELILCDCCKYDKFQIISLRYFNPIGAHPSGLLGERPNNIPNNLMPFLVNVAYSNNITKKEGYDFLSIYGKTYNTFDGTPIRDYIHVDDLANAHILALDKINNWNYYKYFNVGTGKGTTVLELVNIFEKANNVKIPLKIVDKRDGDLETSYCSDELIKAELNFTSIYNLEDMCKHSWNFILKNNITKKKNIFILAGGLKNNGELNEWVKERLNKAIDLGKYNNFYCIGGGTYHKPPILDKDKFVIFESNACVEYLTNKGINVENIKKETSSYDTIGNGFYAFMNFIKPLMLKEIYLITSVFHIDRSKCIFDYMNILFNLNIKINYLESTDIMDNELLNIRISREEKSLHNFKKNVVEKIHSIEKFTEWFYSYHSAYSCNNKSEIIPEILKNSY